MLSANTDDVSYSWDNKWYSQTKVFEGYWIAELAIPFSILRYDENKKNWGINFIRSNRKKNEYHTWMQVPQQFDGVDLGYLGTMIWDQQPPRSGNTWYSILM